jgi:hypothetical protein
VASLALVAPDPADRLDAARRAVRLAHDIDEPWGALCALEATVGALAGAGRVRDAAVLAAATRAARASSGMVAILPGRAAALAQGEEAARTALGEQAYFAALDAGARYDFATAVSAALD